MSRYHLRAELSQRRRDREIGIVWKGFHDVPVRIPEIDVLLPGVPSHAQRLPIPSRVKPAESTSKKPGLFAKAFRAIFSKGQKRGN